MEKAPSFPLHEKTTSTGQGVLGPLAEQQKDKQWSQLAQEYEPDSQESLEKRLEVLEKAAQRCKDRLREEAEAALEKAEAEAKALEKAEAKALEEAQALEKVKASSSSWRRGKMGPRSVSAEPRRRRKEKALGKGERAGCRKWFGSCQRGAEREGAGQERGGTRPGPPEAGVLGKGPNPAGLAQHLGKGCRSA